MVTSSVVSQVPIVQIKVFKRYSQVGAYHWSLRYRRLTLCSHMYRNEGSIAKVNEPSRASDPRDQYAASKALAERAAWDFVKNESVSYDLVTVLPALVGLGAVILDAAAGAKLLISFVRSLA